MGRVPIHRRGVVTLIPPFWVESNRHSGVAERYTPLLGQRGYARRGVIYQNDGRKRTPPCSGVCGSAHPPDRGVTPRKGGRLRRFQATLALRGSAYFLIFRIFFPATFSGKKRRYFSRNTCNLQQKTPRNSCRISERCASLLGNSETLFSRALGCSAGLYPGLHKFNPTIFREPGKQLQQIAG